MNEKIWKECVAFHGHSCPGLAIGFRAAETGAMLLGIPLEKSEDEEIVCVTENDACGIDAIQYVLSCTVGKGNLILRPSGKMAYSFFDRRTGKSVRLVAKRFERNDREAAMNYVLGAPYGELFDIGEPKYHMPEKARFFYSERCENCGEYCREDKIRLREGKMYCSDCFDHYDRG